MAGGRRDGVYSVPDLASYGLTYEPFNPFRETIEKLCNVEWMGTGAMGNNRYEAVISNQIEIMIIAAMETIARTEAKNVEETENDMRSQIYIQPKQSQVVELILSPMGSTSAAIRNFIDGGESR